MSLTTFRSKSVLQLMNSYQDGSTESIEPIRCHCQIGGEL